MTTHQNLLKSDAPGSTIIFCPNSLHLAISNQHGVRDATREIEEVCPTKGLGMIAVYRSVGKIIHGNEHHYKLFQLEG